MKTTKEKMAEAMIALDYPEGNYNEVTMGDDKHIYLKHAQAALDVVCEELSTVDMTIKARNVYHAEYHKKGNTVLESMNEVLKAAADKLRG